MDAISVSTGYYWLNASWGVTATLKYNSRDQKLCGT